MVYPFLDTLSHVGLSVKTSENRRKWFRILNALFLYALWVCWKFNHQLAPPPPRLVSICILAHRKTTLRLCAYATDAGAVCFPLTTTFIIGPKFPANDRHRCRRCSMMITPIDGSWRKNDLSHETPIRSYKYTFRSIRTLSIIIYVVWTRHRSVDKSSKNNIFYVSLTRVVRWET